MIIKPYKRITSYYMIVTKTCANGAFETFKEAMKWFKKDEEAYEIKRVTEIEEVVYKKPRNKRKKKTQANRN